MFSTFCFLPDILIPILHMYLLTEYNKRKVNKLISLTIDCIVSLILIGEIFFFMYLFVVSQIINMCVYVCDTLNSFLEIFNFYFQKIDDHFLSLY